MSDPDRRILQWLLKHEILSSDQLDQACAKRDAAKITLRRAVLDLGFLADDDWQRHTAAAWGREYVDLETQPPTDAARALLSRDVCIQHHVIPVMIDGETLVLGRCEPETQAMTDDLQFLTSTHVRFVCVTEKQLDDAINEGGTPDDEGDHPVVAVVGELLHAAATARATQVHIDSTSDGVVIRFRIDGRLSEFRRLPSLMRRPLVARLKIISNLDIAERRKPQYGRFGLNDPVTDIQISTMPIAGGEERIVLHLRRLTDPILELGQLGLPERIVTALQTVIAGRRGLVIVAGPAQSGVTTTLHALALAAAKSGLDVIAIEESFEPAIPGVTHTHLNAGTGYTIPYALRNVLHQDSDAVLIPALQNWETADGVVNAVARGRLVFAGMHVKSSTGAVTRLTDMGIDPWLISDSVSAVLAQRLVRRPEGGRIAIGDLLLGPLDPKKLPPPGLRKAALDAVSAGLTTMSEAMAVTGADE